MSKEGRAAAWDLVLRRIIATAGEERDLRPFLREVADLVVESTGADACFVHVLDHEEGELVLMGATPQEFDDLSGTIRLPLGEGVAGWVAANLKPAVVADKWADPRYRYIPELRGEQYASLVSVPLRRPGDHLVGVLNVHAAGPDHFDAETVWRLEDVAGLLAGFVEGAVLLDRLQRREADLEAFAVRTVELQELDRRRIAGDIHDGISQRLVSAWYHLRAAMSLSNDPGVDQELRATADLLSEALQDSRRAITGLRPTLLDDLGLSAAITSLASDLPGLDVTVQVAECPLAPHVETAVFRIAQEGLQNVLKHAKASVVHVSLGVERESVVFRLVDDGVGFDLSRPGNPTSFGLSGMQERAALLGGTISVRSAPSEGTRITVTIPRDRALAS